MTKIKGRNALRGTDGRGEVPSPARPEILVGVGGSIAAYKAADVVSSLKKKGAAVSVVMTKAASRFVSPDTLQVLSERPVGLDLFADPGADGPVAHVTVAKRAQAFVIVGATADLLAKLALGLADDFVTTTALVARCPLVLAPAMNTKMWEHPATQGHVTTLLARGARIVEPAEGLLACGDVGTGKLADPEAIVAAALSAAGGKPLPGRLSGKRVLVTAGPTREALDPVRYLSNPSSGKMGYALAEACRDLGAEVVLVSGPVSLSAPAGLSLKRVTTALEMQAEVKKAYKACDAFIAAAAVSDFRPAKPAKQKVKKGGKPEALALLPNPDILLEASKSKGKKVLVGFAAETQDLLKNAGAKLKAKKLDMVVANEVGKPGTGFGSDDNAAVLLWPGRQPERLEAQPKSVLAARIASELAGLLESRT